MGIKKLNSMLEQLDLITELDDISVLNTFLRSYYNLNNNEQIKIVIDTNLYLYKYIRAEKLKNVNITFIDLFKLQIDKFKKYNIIPIYVFDGISDELKNETLTYRLNKKTNAISILADILSDDKKCDIELIHKLAGQSINVSYENINKLQKFLNEYNIPFIISPSETDILCAKLVQYKYAHLCLSEDTDIIIQGCEILAKLNNGKYYIYIYQDILNKLKITPTELCKIASLLGCDYSRSANYKIKPFDLLELCKLYNFNYQKILKNIINLDYHRKYFIDKTTLGLSDLSDMFLSENSNDNSELMIKINRYYNSSFELLNFYNNDPDIVSELINTSFKNKSYIDMTFPK